MVVVVAAGAGGNLKKCQTNNVKRGRVKWRNATGDEIPPEAGRFQARTRPGVTSSVHEEQHLFRARTASPPR